MTGGYKIPNKSIQDGRSKSIISLSAGHLQKQYSGSHRSQSHQSGFVSYRLFRNENIINTGNPSFLVMLKFTNPVVISLIRVLHIYSTNSFIIQIITKLTLNNLSSYSPNSKRDEQKEREKLNNEIRDLNKRLQIQRLYTAEVEAMTQTLEEKNKAMVKLLDVKLYN